MFGKKKMKEVVGTHLSGLDIPENVIVSFSLSDDGIKITAPSMKKEYTIGLSKIQNINYYNETEVEKYSDSSFGKAVIGAAAFGVIGAVIGSRPKSKEKKTVHFYLIVNYSDKQIVIESENGFGVGSIVDFFRKLKPETSTAQTVEL